MIAPPKPPSHDDLELLIKEARARQLRRRLLGAAGIAIAAALGLSAYAFVSGGSPGNLAQPPASGGRVTGPLCRSSQLSGSTFFQGSTQMMVGGVWVTNTSGTVCSLPRGVPAASILWRGRQLPTREVAMAAPAPSITSPARVLSPSAKATVYWMWQSCGGSGPRAAVRPTFVLRFRDGLNVIARSRDLTPAFCGGLGGTRLLHVTRPLVEPG